MDCTPPGSLVQGDSPGKNTGVGSISLLQGIFPTQELKRGFLHCSQILYQLNHQGNPRCYCKGGTWASAMSLFKDELQLSEGAMGEGSISKAWTGSSHPISRPPWLENQWQEMRDGIKGLWPHMGLACRQRDCSHEIKRCLFLGKKPVTKLSSILKNRDVTLPTKVHLVKAMGLPVVIYGCESWTTKRAEHWRTDAFELWCWRGLLRVSWTARRSN